MTEGLNGRLVAIVLPLLIGGSSVSGCGYALAGRGITLPAHIRIIAVPQFVNESNEPELDVRLTDAVRQELQSRGRFTINPDTAGAHAVLTATIRQHTPSPAAFNESGQVSRYRIVVVADVTFRDEVKNEDLFRQSVRVTEEYDLGGSLAPADLAALFRQDRNAIERLSRTFARDVVTSILEQF
jgi:outer membrane lipopolysaccharide assembly protein LptE/RlpB